MLAAGVTAFSWLEVFSKSKDEAALTTEAVPVLAEGSGPGSEGPIEVPDFATLYDRHFALVWRLAASCRVPRSHLDDVVQEIFLVIHRKLPSFEGRSSLRTWVAAITRYTAKEFLRRKRHHILGGEEDPDASASSSLTPAEQLEAVAAARLLDAFLDELPEEQRETFILAEIEQMTAEEIAVVLESNPNTVRSRLRSARQGVQASLARHRAQERWSER